MAIKNTSENARTIKTMWEAMPSDNWSIDRGLTYCNYDNASIVQDEMLLDKYYNYFEQFLIDVTIDQKYYYKPQLYAQDYYGDPGLDYIVLYFAGMSSNLEFNKPNIKILDYSHMKEINQLYTFYKKTVDDSKREPKVYETSKTRDINTPIKIIEK